MWFLECEHCRNMIFLRPIWLQPTPLQKDPAEGVREVHHLPYWEEACSLEEVLQVHQGLLAHQVQVHHHLHSPHHRLHRHLPCFQVVASLEEVHLDLEGHPCLEVGQRVLLEVAFPLGDHQVPSCEVEAPSQDLLVDPSCEAEEDLREGAYLLAALDPSSDHILAGEVRL